jgi:hypothetical protein
MVFLPFQHAILDSMQSQSLAEFFAHHRFAIGPVIWYVIA